MAGPLLLLNARILTLDPSRPVAGALAAVDGAVVAVGTEDEARRALGVRQARVLDARGRVVTPAFIDAHVHLLSWAARLRAVDCSPDRVSSIADIEREIARQARETPPGEWIRAAGYDETALEEKRHPTRHDLDAAAPAHPVRLQHRTGHACVLSTRALETAGITVATPEPPGGFMDRDLVTGEPTGLLIEMDEVVERVVPPLPYDEVAAGMTEVSRRLIESGVTYVEDASTNGRAQWDLLRRLIEDGRLAVPVAMMEGFGSRGSCPELDAGGRLRRSGVKVMPRELEHEVYPDARGLAEMLRAIDGEGRQAAVHAVGERAIATAVDAYDALGRDAVLRRRHRIEHAGVCPPPLAERIAALGLTVVTQPGFVYWNGDAYRQRVPEADIPHLYPLRRLLDAGVRVGGSSDAPVAPADVLTAIRAAVCRRTLRGETLSPDQAIGAEEALAMFTREAAHAAAVAGERGSLRPGLATDFVVLADEPGAADARVLATVAGGEVLYAAAGLPAWRGS